MGLEELVVCFSIGQCCYDKVEWHYNWRINGFRVVPQSYSSAVAPTKPKIDCSSLLEK